MKQLLVLFALFISSGISAQDKVKTENVILVTFDGYRWQELFGGPQKKILISSKPDMVIQILRRHAPN
jgi:hypothetical protein